MVTATLLFASVLNAAENYACNVFSQISEKNVKVVTHQGIFNGKASFDTEETESNTITIANENLWYNFTFVVTTNHRIEISSNELTCEAGYDDTQSVIIMKTTCRNKVDQKKVFTADCQPMTAWQ